MGVDWGAVFALEVSPLEIFLRGSVVYWFVYVLLRLLGRRTIGEVGMADLIVLLLVSDAAQNGMAGDSRSVPEALLLIATLLGWSLAVDLLGFHVPALRKVLDPSRLCLIRNGEVQRRALRREQITLEELKAELRSKGILNIALVSRAWLEADGSLSVRKKRENRLKRA